MGEPIVDAAFKSEKEFFPALDFANVGDQMTIYKVSRTKITDD